MLNKMNLSQNKLITLLDEISSVFRDHGWDPLDISYYRENWYLEINDYLLDILKRLYSLYEEIWLNQRWYFISSLENYITFDDEAKNYLRSHLDSRLVENLWDLYYSTLSDFLEQLRDIITIEDISGKLREASEQIKIAWNISEPYIDKNKLPSKHENAEFEIELLWWINVLSQKIWNLDNAWIWDFLLKLSQKIWSDWEKDSNRPSVQKGWVIDETKKRTKLATALFEASLLLKEAWELLENK